jgi:hypothetical protein
VTGENHISLHHGQKEEKGTQAEERRLLLVRGAQSRHNLIYASDRMECDEKLLWEGFGRCCLSPRLLLGWARHETGGFALQTIGHVPELLPLPKISRMLADPYNQTNSYITRLSSARGALLCQTTMVAALQLGWRNAIFL